MFEKSRKNIKVTKKNDFIDVKPSEIKYENQESSSGWLNNLKKAANDILDIGVDIGKKLSELLDSLDSKYTFDKFLEVLSDKTDEHIIDFQKNSNCFYIGGNIVLNVDDANGKITFAFDGYFNETKDGKGAWHQLSFRGSMLLSKFEDPNESQIQEIRQKSDEGGMKYPVIL